MNRIEKYRSEFIDSPNVNEKDVMMASKENNKINYK